MAKIKTTNAGVFVVNGWRIFTAVGIQTSIVIMEINGEAPTKLGIDPPKDLAISAQDHILEEFCFILQRYLILYHYCSIHNSNEPEIHQQIDKQ